MGLGLGIHGEPGIAEEALPRAGELAAKLVDGILADRPDAADRKIAVVLNGLGQTKYEELFILWAHVARLLAEAGLDLVEPDVGELVTSLDMAGCSLTVTWLNEELELLWRAPADTPAYKKKGWPPSGTRREPRRSIAESTPKGSVTERQKVSPEDHACSLNVVAAIAAMATAMEEAAESLGKLDAVAGDGDHGRGMTRGTRAALESARATQEDGGGPGHVLAAAGRAWADSAGGTSGLLWGAALTALGRRLVESAPLSLGQVAAGVEDAYSEIARLGHAKRGDKTMLDALGPFSDALSQCADDRQALPDAWSAAAAVARKAANETASLRPQVGRARPLAARSVGSPDPGAVSLALCVAAVADVLRTGR
jgi:dihydroxyacetone kinase